MPATQVLSRRKTTPKVRPTTSRPVTELLRELAFVLHSTRVVSRQVTRTGG
jgi:hypothetical protein